MPPKSKPKRVPKKQIEETKQMQEPFKVEAKQSTTNLPEKEKEEGRIEPQLDPPSNKLQIVRQASISSEEGKSMKQSQGKKKSIKSVEESTKKEVSPIKQEPIKQEELPYDQYNVLKISGLLDAYEHFLKLLCKNGLPTGKIYDYAAQQILKYERKKINKELRMRAELDIQKISKRSEQFSPSPEKPRNSSPYYS